MTHIVAPRHAIQAGRVLSGSNIGVGIAYNVFRRRDSGRCLRLALVRRLWFNACSQKMVYVVENSSAPAALLILVTPVSDGPILRFSPSSQPPQFAPLAYRSHLIIYTYNGPPVNIFPMSTYRSNRCGQFLCWQCDAFIQHVACCMETSYSLMKALPVNRMFSLLDRAILDRAIAVFI